MKKVFASITFLLICSTIVFSSEIEGKWKASIKTDNGPFVFYAKYQVNGEKLTGILYNDMGEVEIENGKINGNKFEYTFQFDYSTMKHKGKMVEGVLKIKSFSDSGENEFEMKRVKEEMP